MELNTPTKRYYWHSRVSLDTTRKIAEDFVERRSLNLTVSGRALLNEVLEKHGIGGLNKWDPAHPLIQAIETRWLELLASDQKSFNNAIIKHNGYLERIATVLERMLELATPQVHIEKAEKKAKREKPVEAVEVQETSPAENIPRHEAESGYFGRAAKAGILENKKELGKLLAAARGKLSPPGEKQWSARMVAEAIDHDPILSFEPYIDYTGLIRTPMTANTISGIETGKWWPSAKSLHALVELYKFSSREIENILALLPDPLIESLKNNLEKDSRICMIIRGEDPELQPVEVEQEVAPEVFNLEEPQEEELPEIPVPQENLGEISEPEYSNRALKIAILGQPDKNYYNRVANKEFGRHELVFIDGDRRRTVANGGQYDAMVPLNRLSHGSTEVFVKASGKTRVLRFNKNDKIIRSLNQLKHWLELYDRGLVEL